jgi:high-affinity nickel-transport protein
MRHATDPDHVIAVTAILTRERRLFSAARVGLVWGLGHSATVLLVGTAIVFFKLQVPARLGLGLEFMVAVVLILLGLSAATETLSLIAQRLRTACAPEATLVVHSHPHTHRRRDGRSHTHRHPHAHSFIEDRDFATHDHLMSPILAATISSRSMTKSFLIGLVHGLAGSAAIALLVTAAIPSPSGAILYMTTFCGGVIFGMMLITTVVGAPVVLAAQRLVGLHRKLSMAAGWFSFGFGLFLAYQIGVADQLFGAAPNWFPH